MIISPSRQFVFVHLPKTGGTALSLAYEERARGDDLLFGDTPKAKRRQTGFNKGRAPGEKLSKHSTLSQALAQVPAIKSERWTVAAIVRNPWDRMLSFYAWGRDQSFEHPMIKAAKTLEFAEFLRDPRVTRPFNAMPTPAYLAPTTAPRCLRQETLDADWAALCTDLGFEAPPLSRTNTLERPLKWREQYTPETAALIPPLFPFETDALGYSF